MKTLGNIIRLVFGRIFIAIEYFISSIPLFISIIGIPFGVQTIKLGVWHYGLWQRNKIKAGNSAVVNNYESNMDSLGNLD